MFVLLVLYHGRQVQERTSSSLACSSSSSFTMDVRYKRGHPLLAHVRPARPVPWTSGTREDILVPSMFVLLVLYHGRQVKERTSSSLACSSYLSAIMDVRYKIGHPLLAHVLPPCPLSWTSGTKEDNLFLSMFVLLVLYHRRQVQERTSSSCSYSSYSSFTIDVRYKRGHPLP
jgi:hypothetical protein